MESNETVHQETDAVELRKAAKKMIFVDNDGQPMKFNVTPKDPTTYVNKMKELGGEIYFGVQVENAIAMAPPRWIVPINAQTEYYSYGFIKACLEAGKLVEKTPYRLKPGTRVPNPDLDDDELAINETNDNSRMSLPAYSKTGGRSDVVASSMSVTTSQSSRSGRTPFTFEEDLAIIDFVYDGNLEEMTSKWKKIPNKVWDTAAQRGVFGPHSGDTSRVRYQRILMLDIDKYKSPYEKYLKTRAESGTRNKSTEPVEEAIEMIGNGNDDDDDVDIRVERPPVVAAGTLSSQDGDELLCSQSQIGPAVSTQSANKPLLTSTPFVPSAGSKIDTNSAKPSTPKLIQQENQSLTNPVVHADVVGIVPDIEDYDDSSASSDSSSEPEPAPAPKGNDKQDSDDDCSDEDVISPRKRSRKAGLEDDDQPDESDHSSSSEQGEQGETAICDSLRLKGAAFAAFVSTADNLDEECTQRVTHTHAVAKSQAKKAVPHHCTIEASDKTLQENYESSQGEKPKDDAIVGQIVNDESHGNITQARAAMEVETRDEVEELPSIDEPVPINPAITKPVSSPERVVVRVPDSETAPSNEVVADLPSGHQNTDRVEESMPFKLVSALAQRYKLDPHHILEILKLADGSFRDAIYYIEQDDSAIPKRAAQNKDCSGSSEKEN